MWLNYLSILQLPQIFLYRSKLIRQSNLNLFQSINLSLSPINCYQTKISKPQMKYRQKQNYQQKGQRNFKYQQKDRKKGRFNFDWDEDSITYRTQIPLIPEKQKAKPDPMAHQKKIKQVDARIEDLKQKRKEKKNLYKQQTNSIEQDVEELKYKIELGEKCIKVLQYDQRQGQRNIEDIENKIRRNKRDINNLEKQPFKQQKKTYEDMTYEQLVRQENKLTSKMTVGNLSKKDEIDISATLNKISRFKVNAPRSQDKKTNNKSQDAIQNLKSSNDRLHKAQLAIKDKIAEINTKIESIQQDIKDFKEQQEDLQASRKTLQQKSILYQQARALKTKIYEMREERDQLEQAYQNKLYQYQYEQQKIKWIQWAQQVQQRKNREWQQEKAKRKKQKLKFKEGTNQNKQKQTDAPEKKFERTVINKYQTQIDNCSFLINYCKGLYPSQNSNVNKQLEPQNLNQALKKGQWSKMKGVQLIVSKKKKEEDSTASKKQSGIKKKKQQPKNQTKSKFDHTFFMEQIFDKVNVLPPTQQSQLDKTIKDLQQKQAYYLKHPEGKQSDRKIGNDKYVPEKFTKMKAQQNKKGISHEDFPSLP